MWADMVQEMLKPLVDDKMPCVPAIQNRRSLGISLAAGDKNLGANVVVRQVMVESELWRLSIPVVARLGLGKFGLGDLYPHLGNEQPFIDLKAYLGRNSQEFKWRWRCNCFTGELGVL